MYRQLKNFFAFLLSDVVFIILINVKMPTIVSSFFITVWRSNPLIRAIDAVYECGEIARRAEVPAALRSRLNLLNDEISYVYETLPLLLL